jgi:hypothetical protein
MKSIFVNKINHPMFDKTHDKVTLNLKSKSGELNSMFGKLIVKVQKFNVN